MRLLILFIILIFISCQEPISSHKKEKKLSPLSEWLVANEDSLAFYFDNEVKKSISATSAPNERLVSREFQFNGGFIGQLSQKIHHYDSCIEVYYLYEPDEQPKLQILLSPNFNSKCTNAVDSIFADIDSLKYFRLVKFRQAGSLFSAYLVEEDTIWANELWFKPIPNHHKYDLDVYVTKNLSNHTKEALLSSVFGEEVQLKKLNIIRFVVRRDSINSLMGLRDIKKFFGVKY